jgi:tRNA dimethylallyltransferase
MSTPTQTSFPMPHPGQDSGLRTEHTGLIVIAGPTGAGKSDLALRLAQAAGGEIVNYDSVQIYRGFDVGSAKPPREVRESLPHHLYDIVDADQEFNAGDYGRIAREVCTSVIRRGRAPILVGGTFFYLRALLSGLPEMPGRDPAVRERLRRVAASPRGQARLHRWLSRVDPESGRRIAPADRQRVERALEVWITSGKAISTWRAPAAGEDEIPSLKIALSLRRDKLVEIIDARVETMYRSGLVEETAALLERFPRTARPFGTIGYKEAAAMVAGEMTRDAAIAETQRRTRAYAKRQMSWLRAEPRMHWLDAEDKGAFPAAMRLIEDQR